MIRAERGRHRLELVRLEPGQRDSRSAARRLGRHRGPDSTGAARDEEDLAFERSGHGSDPIRRDWRGYPFPFPFRREASQLWRSSARRNGGSRIATSRSTPATIPNGPVTSSPESLEAGADRADRPLAEHQPRTVRRRLGARHVDLVGPRVGGKDGSDGTDREVVLRVARSTAGVEAQGRAIGARDRDPEVARQAAGNVRRGRQRDLRLPPGKLDEGVGGDRNGAVGVGVGDSRAEDRVEQRGCGGEQEDHRDGHGSPLRLRVDPPCPE